MISKEKKSALLQFWKVSKFPFLLALVWTAFSFYFSNEINRTIINSIKDFIAAFFFIMWFVGQYLRAEKDIRDKSSYNTIQTGINELKSTIENLGKTFTTSTTTTTATSTLNPMLSEAKDAIDKGFILAGLMQAGVAFEQVIVETAKRKEIKIDKETTTARLINKLKEMYDQGIGDELFAVWKLRNELIHLNSEAAEEIKKNQSLFKYFEWAINYLENN